MALIPRVIRQGTGVGRAASGADFGADSGLQELGGALDQVSESARAYMDASRRSQVSREVADLSLRLAELGDELDTRMGAVGREEDPAQAIEQLRLEYSGRAERLRSESRGRILGGPYQALFEERSLGLFGRYQLDLKAKARARNLEGIRARTIESVETLTDLIDRSDNDQLRAEYLSQIGSTLDDAVSSGAYTEDQAARVRAQSDDKLRASELRATSQGNADEIAESTQDPRERLRIARERYSGDMRDKVIARLKDRSQEDAATAKAQRDAALTDAVTRAYAGELSRAQALELGLDAPALKSVMSILDREGEVDSSLYFELLAEAESPATVERFRSRNLLELADRLNKADLEKLIRKQGESDSESLDSYSSKVNAAMAGLGLPTTAAQVARAKKAGDEDEIRRATLFRRQIEAERERRQREKGRRLNSAELDELVDFGMQQVVVDSGWLGDDSQPRFATLREDIDDIPTEALQAIKEALRARGADPNDSELISETYLEALRSGEL